VEAEATGVQAEAVDEIAASTSLVAGGLQCYFITLLTLQLGFERFQDFSLS